MEQQIRTGAELLTDEIAQKIKAKIQNRQYKAGQRLTVRLLCEEFGTSETPVKQALNQLVTTGLVVSIPKCGMRVREFNFQDILRISNEEYKRCIQDYTKENFNLVHEHDRVLHSELVKCCQNAQIMDMYNSLNAIYTRRFRSTGRQR